MKLIDVLKLEEDKQHEYFIYFDIVKPKDIFKYRLKKYTYKNIEKFSFKDADYIRRLMNDSDFKSTLEVFSMCYNIPTDKIYKIKFSYFISCLKNIYLNIERISKDEEKLSFLTPRKVEMALKQSKSEVMNQFGIYNQIDSLTKGDITKFEEVENMEYGRVKFLLTFEAVKNDFNRRFQENYNKINKHIK